MYQDATLTVAVALTAGMIAHAVARRLRLPSIVVLLASGALLGPDALALVRPQTLGNSLYALVGAAVAVILFEGGLHLQWRRLRREPHAIRRLVTWGAVLSSLGGALAAKLIMSWSWRPAVLFGILMMVTGPTVVTPLLRRLRLRRNVATVLEAEGVLIDAVGAITAAVALEVALRPSENGVLLAAPEIALRLGFGALLGLMGGAALSLLLRFRVVPGELQNTLALAAVLLLNEGANSLLPDSGLAAATTAGITVGNLRAPATRSLVDFKQQLVHLLIGMLFLLLVADVRLETVLALGWPGVLTVAVLMFAVRPVVAFLCTIGSSLELSERAFVAWMSPRGVVAAAVASLFAFRLQQTGAEGGLELRALVFATIAATVLWCSLTGAPIAGLLGLRRPTGRGWVVLGGNVLARQIARLLEEGSKSTVLLDNDPQAVRAVESSGLRALLGNAFDERLLTRAELQVRSGVIGVTANPEANLLFAQHVAHIEPDLPRLVAVRDLEGVTTDMVNGQGARVLFGQAIDVALWSRRLQRREAQVEWWSSTARRRRQLPSPDPNPACVPLVSSHGGNVVPVADDISVRFGQLLAFAVDAAGRERAHAWLFSSGFRPAPLRDSPSGLAASEAR